MWYNVGQLHKARAQSIDNHPDSLSTPECLNAKTELSQQV